MIRKDINALVRKGELTKIENYDKAVADKSQMWVCHHRLELTLDGEFAHSFKDLIRMGMYYHRPYFELIFLTDTEHRRLHGKARSEEHKDKLNEAVKAHKDENVRRLVKANKGKHLSEEHKKKLSEAHKGRERSEEHRKNLSEALKGRKHSEEHRKKVSEAMKGKYKSEEHKKNISKGRKGIIFSEEHRKNISEARKRYFEKKKQMEDSYDGKEN